MKKVLSLVLALCLVMSLFVSVVSADSEYNDDLTIVMFADFISLQPMYCSDLHNQNICLCVYDALFELNENLEGVPYLVKEWHWVDDVTAEFTLHDNIYFHDGNLMDTEDVKFNVDYARSQNWFDYLSEDCEIVDQFTFRLHLKANYPAIATEMTGPHCWIIEKESYEECLATGNFDNPMTSGRYYVSDRVEGDSITVTRFDNYWNQDDPALNHSICFKAIPESSNRTIMLETGEADLDANFMTADYERVKNNPDLQLVEHYSATIFFLGMDFNNPYFANQKVRQAVAYALNRQEIIDLAYDGLGKVQYSCIPPTGIGYVENPGNWSYDLDKAKALMEESGVGPFETTIYVVTDNFESIATVVASQLSKIGITADVQKCMSLSTQAAAGQMPMWCQSWGCYADPDLHLMYLFTRSFIESYNRSHYSNDEFEEMHKSGRTTDDAKRIEVYKQIQDKFAEEAVIAPIFTNYQYVSARAGLEGIQVDTESPFHYHTLHY